MDGRRAQAVAERWALSLGRPLPGGTQALLAEATTADGDVAARAA